MVDDSVRTFLRDQAKERFLRYVTIDTASDFDSGMHPSSEGQWVLARLLEAELRGLGLRDVLLDPFCYVYATVPASPGVEGPPVTFCAHMDTSPSEPGAGVTPVLHESYDGGLLTLPCGATLSPDECPELAECTGGTIITSDGTTLLGADDKAGIAEIMAALAACARFEDLAHPELRIVFTPDEEIGEGADHITVERLGRLGYTMDGGMAGELEYECFDAWKAAVTVHGRNIHPGHAKNRMINAAAVAARLVAALPEHETPEHTEGREGFFHLTDLHGDENRATAHLLIRDFDRDGNRRRMEYLGRLAESFELGCPGLVIDVDFKDQYRNMREVLAGHPRVVETAERAIEAAGLTVTTRPIRGGTDGARFSFLGMPCPNIFSGGMMVHSKREWVAEKALEQGAEVILHLCRLWSG